MLTKDQIENTIGNYENVRELVDLIRTLQEEAVIYKACIANLIDHTHGSTYGTPEYHEKLVGQFAETYQVTEAMAKVFVDASIETSENCNFGII